MRATIGEHYLEYGAVFRTYTIDIEHSRGSHSEQVMVFGNQALAIEIVRLINEQWTHRNTNQFNSTPDKGEGQ